MQNPVPKFFKKPSFEQKTQFKNFKNWDFQNYDSGFFNMDDSQVFSRAVPHEVTPNESKFSDKNPKLG